MELATAPPATPLSISVHVLPPSWVRQKCGFMSSSRRVLAAAYAVLVVEVARVHVEDARPGLDLGRSDVVPLGAAVGGDLDDAIARARPKHVDVEGRGRDRGDGARRRRGHGGGVLAGIAGLLPCLAGEIAADGGPTVTAVDGLPHAGGPIEEHIGILGRPDDRLRAHGARRWFG